MAQMITKIGPESNQGKKGQRNSLLRQLASGSGRERGETELDLLTPHLRQGFGGQACPLSMDGEGGWRSYSYFKVSAGWAEAVFRA